MNQNIAKSESVNVLINDTNWAWPQAVTEIFHPHGINAILADSSGDIVRLITHNKIHLAILDEALDEFSGIQTLRTIRNHDRQVPCILLAQQVNQRLLAQALRLGVFSVIDKPVDISLLAENIKRLFFKNYAIDMFSGYKNLRTTNRYSHSRMTKIRKFTTVIKWTRKKIERSNETNEGL